MASEKRSRRTPNLSSREHSGQNSPSPLVEVKEISKDTPRDFLFKNHVHNLVSDAINCLIMYRPEDPILFLMNYFKSSSNDPVVEACSKLLWAHYTNKAYQRNVLEVYNELIAAKCKHSHLCGLLGERFNQLLLRLSADLPEQISDACIRKLQARDSQVIIFNRFYHAILLLHVIKDFIKTLKDIYQDLDVGNVGKATDGLCSLILSKLQCSSDALEENKEGETSINTEFKGLSISTEKFGSESNTNINDLQEMIDSVAASSKQPEYMEQDAFVDMAVQIFLDKV